MTSIVTNTGSRGAKGQSSGLVGTEWEALKGDSRPDTYIEQVTCG